MQSLETVQKIIAEIYFSKVIKVIRIRGDNNISPQASCIRQIQNIGLKITKLWEILTGCTETPLKKAL